MTKRLTKGANTSLTGPRPGLGRVLVGIGWRSTSAAPWTIDITVLLCDDRNHVPSAAYVIPAGQVTPATSAGAAAGLDLTSPAPAGAADPVAVQGPDHEQFEIDLHAVPGYIQSVVFAAAIVDAAERRQTFGQLADIYLRLVDLADGSELARFDIDHDCSGETALALAEIYRKDAEWKMRAIGQGWASGMQGLRTDYGARP